MRRYLLVDDNRAFAENLAEILTDTGAVVDIADSGAEALEAAARHPYDALLTDMKMPGMTGAELVERAHGIDPALPAVVITAYTNDEDLAAARRHGILGVLPKPAPVARLLELMASARRGGLIMIVGDDAALADGLCEILSTKGFAAVTSSSLADANLAGAGRPFAALVDLRVPGGPGGAPLGALTSAYPGLPVVALEKPVDPAQLLVAIEALFEARAR